MPVTNDPDIEPCPNCGEPDPEGDHYDAWSDYGDGEGPDGWQCEHVPNAGLRWDAWAARNQAMTDEK